jgi:hypothetical protein
MGILPRLWERIFLLRGCDFTWFWGLAGLKRPILPLICQLQIHNYSSRDRFTNSIHYTVSIASHMHLILIYSETSLIWVVPAAPKLCPCP